MGYFHSPTLCRRSHSDDYKVHVIGLAQGPCLPLLSHPIVPVENSTLPMLVQGKLCQVPGLAQAANGHLLQRDLAHRGFALLIEEQCRPAKQRRKLNVAFMDMQAVSLSVEREIAAIILWFKEIRRSTMNPVFRAYLDGKPTGPTAATSRVPIMSPPYPAARCLPEAFPDTGRPAGQDHP